MDPSITCCQPEQEGPAKQLWLRLWQTQQDLDNMNLKEGDNDLESINNALNNQNQQNIGLINGKNDKNNMFVQRSRKVENRASTRTFLRCPEKLIGLYGGTAWRKRDFQYSKGVIG